MSMLDLIAVGDATKDVFVDIHEATLNCTLNHQTCLLCFNYADKIPVKNVTQVPVAGNAANAAVGSARLGHTSSLLAIIGDDTEGRDLMEALRKEDVDTRAIRIDKTHGTNYSTVLNFRGERTILVYHQPRKYVFPAKPPQTKWMYYTSIGQHHERFEKDMLAYLARHPKTNLLFNPGTHQLRRKLKALRPVIKRSEIFIINKEEAAFLLGDTNSHIPNLMVRFRQIGAHRVIITDGADGSWACEDGHAWFLPMFPGKAIERTGAGDAYATGVANALIEGCPLPEALRWGTANAQSVVHEIGPQRGLLNRTGMKNALKRHAHIQPKRITSNNLSLTHKRT